MLEKAPERRLPSVARAAASPGAVALAGAGVFAGEATHLGLPVAVLLGAAGFAARLAWAAVHRRLLLRRRSARRFSRVDPWSVPEPWRGYTARALDARRRLRQLARDRPAGPVGDYLSTVLSQVDVAVDEQWALARSGAALGAPLRRAETVAAELSQVQSELKQVRGVGAGATTLSSREEALASELRSLRRTELVSAEMSGQLAALSAQLEGLVAAAAQLVGTASTVGTDVGALSSELVSLRGGLEEARRIMASASGPSASGDS